MIDDEKLEEAIKCQLDKLGSYGLNEDEIGRISSLVLYREEDIKDSFKAAIDWFLDNLWHSTSEEPKSNSNILIKIKAYKLVLYPEGKKEDICSYFYKVIEYDKKDKWKLPELEKKYQCNLKVIEWLYIDDLFPKEGGKQ